MNWTKMDVITESGIIFDIQKPLQNSYDSLKMYNEQRRIPDFLKDTSWVTAMEILSPRLLAISNTFSWAPGGSTNMRKEDLATQKNSALKKQKEKRT